MKSIFKLFASAALLVGLALPVQAAGVPTIVWTYSGMNFDVYYDGSPPPTYPDGSGNILSGSMTFDDVGNLMAYNFTTTPGSEAGLVFSTYTYNESDGGPGASFFASGGTYGDPIWVFDNGWSQLTIDLFPGYTLADFATPGDIYTVDGGTTEYFQTSSSFDLADITRVGSSDGLNTLTGTLVPVPEPASLLVFGTALIGIGGVLRRRSAGRAA